MLANFLSWWLARISELLPSSWVSASARLPDGYVVDTDTQQNIVVSIRRGGKLSASNLGAAARQAGRKTVLVRPPAQAVLVKNHTVPTVPRRQLEQMLRHELARITPFAAEDLFWRWDSVGKSGNGTRTDVVLTMVPRAAVVGALNTLEQAGMRADLVEANVTGQARLLPVGDIDRSGRRAMIRVAAAGCVGLLAATVILPFALQAVALYRVNGAIEDLQPAIAKVNAIRQGIATGDAGREVLTKEMERTGDLLQILATVTRILPDDTYLTDFSLRERQMSISGRSASAPRLITGLSADPAIQDTAFAAPVTRVEGATSDVFSIKAGIAK